MKFNSKKMIGVAGLALAMALVFTGCSNGSEEPDEFSGNTFYEKMDVSEFGVAGITEIDCGEISFYENGKGLLTSYGINGEDNDYYSFTFKVKNGIATIYIDDGAGSTSKITDGCFTLMDSKWSKTKGISYEEFEKKLNGEMDLSKICLWDAAKAGNSYNAATGLLRLNGQWSGAGATVDYDASNFNYLKIEYEDMTGSLQFFVVYDDEYLDTDNESKTLISLDASETTAYITLDAVKKEAVASYQIMADTTTASSITIKKIEFVYDKD